MNYLQIIKNRKWKEEESPASIFILDHWKTGHLETINAFGKLLYSKSIYYLADGYGYEWTPLNDTKKTLSWVLHQYKNNRQYFLRKLKEFKSVSEKIKKEFDYFLRTNVRSLSNSQIADHYEKIYHLGKNQYGYGLITECLDTIDEDDYLKILPEVNVKDLPSVIENLSLPDELSAFGKEKLDLLKIASKKLEGEKINDLIEKHTRDYFWVQNNFRRAVYLDQKYFLEALQKLIKNKTLLPITKLIKNTENRKQKLALKRQEIYKKYNVTEKTSLFFEIIRLLSLIQDKRKENVQRMVYCIDQASSEAARRNGLAKEQLTNYFVDDVLDLLKHNKRLSLEESQKRIKLVYFSYLDKGKIKTELLYGEKADSILGYFKNERKKIIAKGLIKGFVASLGKGQKLVIGKVRIIFDPIDCEFHTGEILVTGMTRPEYVPLMKKAKAIITNEGGITTHAAIVSRELGVPCIIGTKIATEALKNDDTIEMNMESGQIRKIHG